MATITKRGNSYLIRVSAGYDASGKQIMKSMTWKIPEGMKSQRSIEKALNNAALEFENKVKSGEVSNQKIKFSAFAEKWISDYAELHLRPKTLARYRGLLERINAEIGYMYLDKIRPDHLYAFYKKLGQTEKERNYTQKIDIKAYLKSIKMTQTELATIAQVSTGTTKAIISGKNICEDTAKKISQALGKNLSDLFSPVGEPECISNQTILHYHRLISVILQTAVEWQYIPKNWAEIVTPPKVKKEEAFYLNEEQAFELLDLLEDQPIYYRTAIELLLFTGLRRGELLGLEWNDIDFDAMKIRINKTIQYLPDRGVFEDETKKQSSNRCPPVPACAIDSLRKYQLWLRKELFAIGEPFDPSSRVFVSQNLTPMHPDTLTTWFCNFIKTTDLPQIHIHSLRHTCASLQIANGEAATTVARNLGHSSPNTTMKVYAHAIESAQTASAERMNALFSQRKKAVNA